MPKIESVGVAATVFFKPKRSLLSTVTTKWVNRYMIRSAQKLAIQQCLAYCLWVAPISNSIVQDEYFIKVFESLDRAYCMPGVQLLGMKLKAFGKV